MAKVGIVRDDRYLLHDMGPHPESPDRLRTIYQMLDNHDMNGLFPQIPARPATRGELETIHSAAYVNRVAETAGKPHIRLDPDTSTSAGSYEAAIWAAGGFMAAIDAVAEGKLNSAFALVRPPGHHAERDRAMGFCLFNNVAIGARYAQKQRGLERILIVDWDLHHGNGTQNAFYEDPHVLYFSTHQYPYYPGSGAAYEVGNGKGEGYTVNVPLSYGYGDSEYGNVYNHILKPISLVFQPQMVLVSAGFDIHYRDPLGGMTLTETGFARLMNILKDIAKATCSGKIAVALEGGYDLAGLSQSVKEVLMEMKADDSWVDRKKCLTREAAGYKDIEGLIEKIQKIQKQYWNCF